MKKIFLSFTSIAALSLIIIWGCKQELDYSPQSESSESRDQIVKDRDGDPQTVLGQKRIIPYKVDIIKQAYNNLYEPDLTTLNPNHLYVRFLPQSPQDVKKMLQSGIEFWDYPLDYDMVSIGEDYHDPSVSDSTYTWQYAVVEVNTVLPTVQYEILEQLALVPEDCAIAKEAFDLTGNEFEIPDEFDPKPAIVDGKFDFHIDHGGVVSTPGAGGPIVGCNCTLPDHIRKPSGCVQVFDNKFSAWEGVINVEVRTSKSRIFGAAFYRKTETSSTGCWEIDHKYKGKIHVWVKWDNSTCDLKTMKYGVDLWGYSFSRKAYIGKFWGPNFNNIPIKFDYTNDIGSKTFRNWVASSVNNSVFEYNGFVASQGIAGSLPGNLQILITPWGTDNIGSAPMLDKMGFVQQVILFGPPTALMAGLFGVVSAIPVVPIALWLEVFAPDITLNLNLSAGVNSDQIRELSYHELSHALHFNQVGSNYWLSNIAYTVLNNGYGDGTAPGAGKCSVIESWGWMIGMQAAHLRYGPNNSNSGNAATNTWRKRLEEQRARITIGPLPHIPHGWLWDLQDNNFTNPSTEVENALVTDLISGITNAQIFSRLTSNMNSMPQMKGAIAPFLPPSVPVATYNALCASYGF